MLAIVLVNGVLGTTGHSPASSRGKEVFPRQEQNPLWHGEPEDFRLWKSCENLCQIRGLIQGSQVLIILDSADWRSCFGVRRARNCPASTFSRSAVASPRLLGSTSIGVEAASTSPAGD